jgi:hypothetical protein
MLPLSTAFKQCYRSFKSAKDTIGKVREICEELKIPGGTALYGILNCSGTKPLLFLSSAGHPKLLVASNEGLTPLPSATGSPLIPGVRTDDDYLLEESRHELAPGDVIVAFTDGVPGAGEKGPLGSFGMDRLRGLIDTHRAKSAEEIARTIEEKILEHAGENLDDDYTILVLKMNGRPAAPAYVEAIPGRTGCVEMRWERVVLAARYHVEFEVSEDTIGFRRLRTVEMRNNEDPRLTVSKLTSGERVRFRVIAEYENTSEGPPSAAVEAIVP